MASQAQQAKVLRIAILQDGKMVNERLIRPGESVTVGESAKSTFVLPRTHLPKAEFPLFQARGGAYVLQFTDQMKGRISAGGPVVVLDRLKADPSVERKGNFWQLKLGEQDRGKIAIDQITVLFQFVPPPPTQAVKPLEAMDFRPRLLEDDDPLFLGFLALFAALATVLGIYVYTAEVPETSRHEIPDRFARILQDREPPEVEEEVVVSDEGKAVERETEPEPVERTEREREAPQTAEDAAREEQMREEAAAQIHQFMATMGRTATTVGFDHVLTDHDDIAGTDEADVRRNAPRLGAGDRDAAGIDAETRAGSDVGTGDIAGGAPRRPQINPGEGIYQDDMPQSAQAEIRRVVMGRHGQLQQCYERELRLNPDLQGRVEVEWRIVNGATQNVTVVANTTGDQNLATCIVRTIDRWRFPAGIDTDRPIIWPFTFRSAS